MVRKAKRKGRIEKEIERKLLTPEEKTYIKLRAAGVSKDDAYATVSYTHLTLPTKA